MTEVVKTIKERVFEEIQKTKDDNMRAVLWLMMGVLEYTDASTHRIESKIDSLRNDEVALRKVVLNGHDSRHHTHHDWLEQRIAKDQFYTDFIKRAEPLLDWAEQHKEDQEKITPVCEWASSKMEEEKENKTIVKKRIDNIITSLGEKLLWLFLGMLVYATGAGFPIAKQLLGG